jgi:hypothetical protein
MNERARVSDSGTAEDKEANVVGTKVGSSRDLTEWKGGTEGRGRLPAQRMRVVYHACREDRSTIARVYHSSREFLIDC